MKAYVLSTAELTGPLSIFSPAEMVDIHPSVLKGAVRVVGNDGDVIITQEVFAENFKEIK